MVAVLALANATEAPFMTPKDIADTFDSDSAGVATEAARSPMEDALTDVITILAQAGTLVTPAR